MQHLPNTYIKHVKHVGLLLLNSLLSSMHGSRQGYTLHRVGYCCQQGAAVLPSWFRWEMSACLTGLFTVNCTASTSWTC